jgi:hypothetical protein
MTQPPNSVFERWFTLLARHRMSGALLPICGIAIGNVLVQEGRIWPDQFSWYVQLCGVVLISCCSVLFLIFAIFRTWRSLK